MKWQQVFDQLSHAFFILDEQGNLVQCNSAAQPFLIVALPEANGRFLPDSVVSWLPISDLLQSPGENTIDLAPSIHHKQPLQLSITPMVDENGQINGRMLTIKNHPSFALQQALNDAKKQIETAVNIKSNFLDVMSHELRTPLNAVTGHINMLRNTKLDSEQIDIVKSVIENGDKLSQIITNLLEYSQADGEHFELNPQPFHLKELLHSITTPYKSIVYDKPISLTWRVKEGTPTILLADYIRFRQILNYLLDNAIKYTEEGSICVTAGILDSKSSPLTLQIMIEDTGVGIPLEYQSQIFQTFNQVDNSLTRKHGGLGLSLAIAKKLCEHMGGSLQFSSLAGEGTTFTATISAEISNVQPVKTYQTSSYALRNKRILLVGRNADYRRMISRDSKLGGMLPYVASSDGEALYWLRKDQFDVICIEDALLIQTPDLISQIRKMASYTAVPFILVSESTNEEIDLDDFSGILQVPFSSTDIYDVLIRAFHKVTKTLEPKVAEPQESSLMADNHPLTMLLVEDNTINQKVIIRMLARLGYTADVAQNGQIGLEMVLQNSYDVILMDIQMPVMDGVTATKRIRKLGDNIIQPQIIAVTAHAREGDRERYLAAGMNDYLSKPVKMEGLVNALYSCEVFANRMIGEPVKVESEPATPSGINHATLASLFGDEVDEFLAEMGPVFIENSQKLLTQIKAAINLDDLESVKDAAHALKGSSASLGMELLSKLCSDLEKCSQRKGTIKEVDTIFRDVCTEYGRVSVELTQGQAEKTVE